MSNTTLKMKNETPVVTVPSQSLGMKALPKILLALTAVAALSVAHPAKANLITNPGFETGNLTGWTFHPGFFAVGTASGVSPHSGSYQAFSSTGSGVLQQSFATTLGQSYTVDFWAATTSGGALNVLGGSTVFNHIFAGPTSYTSTRLLSPPRAPLRQYNLTLLASSFWTTSALLRRAFPMAARQFLCSVAHCLAWRCCGANCAAKVSSGGCLRGGG